MSLSLSSYRERIVNSFRQNDRNAYFNRIRLEILSDLGHSKSGTVYSTQEDILLVMEQYKQTSQPINWPAINDCICEFKENFDEGIVYELSSLVIDRFRDNGHALASMAHLIAKRNELPSPLAAPGTLHLLLSANCNLQNQELTNGRVLVYLIYQMLTRCEHIENFLILTDYYAFFSAKLGQQDTLVLLLLAETSRHRQLLPSEDLIDSILRSQIQLDPKQDEGLAITKLCELIHNYMRFQNGTQMYQRFCAWLHQLLRNRSIPIRFKNESLNLLTTLLNSQTLDRQTRNSISELPLFQEIVLTARLGSLISKLASLDVLAALLKGANGKDMQWFIDQDQVIEALVYGLDLQMEPDLMFRLLNALILLAESSPRTITKMLRVGIMRTVLKLATSPYIQTAQTAALFQQILSESYPL